MLMTEHDEQEREADRGQRAGPRLVVEDQLAGPALLWVSMIANRIRTLIAPM